jgi:hypothetical protein
VRRASLAAATSKESLGVKPWDLYMVLRDDPTLAAELSAQAALLEFIVRSDHASVGDADRDRSHGGTGSHEVSAARGSSALSDWGGGGGGDDDDWFGLLDFEDVRNVKGSVAQVEQTAALDTLFAANLVPSDSFVSAFVCVAKLKLCRLASAQRAAGAGRLSGGRRAARARLGRLGLRQRARSPGVPADSRPPQELGDR